MSPTIDPIKKEQWYKNRSGKNHYNYGKHLSKETRTKISEICKGKSLSKEHRNKIRDAHKGLIISEGTRRKISEKHIGKHPSEKTRRRMSESGVGGFWYGNVTYPPVYCELWTLDFRERVRAFFDYKCVECGSPQNGGKRHSVHHVHYDKKVCCKENEAIGERKFVPLCKSCHSKTNYNHEYWEKHYTDLINEFYLGKSYLTIEEIRELKAAH